MNNIYEELYAHIRTFEEERKTNEIDDWDEFISKIKKIVLLRQIASYKEQIKSTAE